MGDQLNPDAPSRPPVAHIRAAFDEYDTAMERFGETGKPADKRAWKGKGGALEVVCLGYMRRTLDYLECIEAINIELLEALTELEARFGHIYCLQVGKARAAIAHAEAVNG